MNYLGIDYGQKRIGLSFADELGVAYPLPAAIQKELSDRLGFIKSVITKRNIKILIVGYPYELSGAQGSRIETVEGFIQLLEQKFGLPIIRVDERLTTHKAESDMKLFKKKTASLHKIRSHRKTGDVDSRAATIILQDFLESKLAETS
jgi:putative Holliday junction resolvase